MSRVGALNEATLPSWSFPQEYSPSLDLLRQLVDEEVSGFTIRKIKKNAGPASVYRIYLQYPRGAAGPASVILKHISGHWPDDPSLPEREVRFYTQLLPRSGIELPVVFYAGMDPQGNDRLILLEDLGDRFRFPPPTYRWRPGEVERFLRAYAHLHVLGVDRLPPVSHRGWMFTYFHPRWNSEDVLRQLDDLHTWGFWPALAGADKLIEHTLEGLKNLPESSHTLVHHDVYPPNIGLPASPGEHAVIIDWEMGGWGPGEIDLAYLFTQPYGASAEIPRHEALDAYWIHRQELEGRLPAASERMGRQWLADSLFALGEVGVAHRVALQPFPPGSAPHRYWQAMYAVLYNRLAELASIF
jgi:Phosphotransferase enzyme family